MEAVAESCLGICGVPCGVVVGNEPFYPGNEISLEIQ